MGHNLEAAIGQAKSWVIGQATRDICYLYFLVSHFSSLSNKQIVVAC